MAKESRAIRVAFIDSGAEDAKEGDRLRLELRRNNGGELRWYDATTGEWIESHDIKSVKEAMDTLYAWYGRDWQLSVGVKGG